MAGLNTGPSRGFLGRNVRNLQNRTSGMTGNRRVPRSTGTNSAGFVQNNPQPQGFWGNMVNRLQPQAQSQSQGLVQPPTNFATLRTPFPTLFPGGRMPGFGNSGGYFSGGTGLPEDNSGGGMMSPGAGLPSGEGLWSTFNRLNNPVNRMGGLYY